jgi:hypothetical protein
VVFAGHGFFAALTDQSRKTIRLPNNVTMVFWCHHGESLLDDIGTYIEQRKDISNLPEYLAKQVRIADARNLPEVYSPGSEVFNYRLIYPSGLLLGANPQCLTAYSSPGRGLRDEGPGFRVLPSAVRDPTTCIVGNWSSDLLQGSLSLGEMLNANMSICANNTVHWTACRLIRML